MWPETGGRGAVKTFVQVLIFLRKTINSGGQQLSLVQELVEERNRSNQKSKFDFVPGATLPLARSYMNWRKKLQAKTTDWCDHTKQHHQHHDDTPLVVGGARHHFLPGFRSARLGWPAHPAVVPDR